MMNRRIYKTLFGLLFAMVLAPGYAIAGTLDLLSFTDQTSEPINLPATQYLMATIATSAAKGGNDATSTAVTIGGTVAPADIAQVCVDYGGSQVSCATNPGSLSNISLTLGGNEKGGSPFDYRVTLNSSAAGKTISLTVVSITTSNPNPLTLPQSTATRTIAAAATPPTIDTPTFTTVTSGGATLGGNITSLGTAPAANNHGTAWNHTGSPVTENASSLGTPSLGAFTDARTGMNSADQVFFRAFVTQSGTNYYTTESSFFTYPANDPTGFSIDQVTSNSMRINWTDSSETGDAGGSIVIVSGVDGNISAPSDGSDYTGDPVWPFSVSSGTDDWVVFKGSTGGTASVTLLNLPENSQFWVAVYSYSGTGGGVSGVRYKATTTATGNATTGVNLPVVGSPTFSAVQNNGATLGIDSVTGSAIDDKGTAWAYTTGVTEASNPLSFGSGPGAFSHARTGMNSADQVFFKGYAHNAAGYTLTAEASFFTYPANDPIIGAFTGVDSNNITINWTNSSETGDAGGSIVVVSTADDGFTVPVDGTDYTPNAVYPFTSLGGNDYVVYKGTGNTVTISSLPPSTQIWVAIYSYSGSGAGASGVRYKTPTTATGTETTTAGSTPPSIDTPTFSVVTSSGATLGGHVVSIGANPTADAQGTVWNHTGGLPTENALAEGGTPADNTAFSHPRTGMNSADQVFFRAYVEQSAIRYYTAVSSFFTYPANDPASVTFPATGPTSMQINWTPSTETGDAGGSIVIVSSVDATITAPVDGADYTPNAVYPFGAGTSGDDFVVYKGNGSSVNITGLPQGTQFWVAIYSYSGTGAGASGVRYKTDGTPATGTDTTTAGSTPPSIDTPTFSGVTSSGATLGGHVVSVGANPAADAQGTVWNHTGGSPTENALAEGGTPADNTAFSHARTGMNTADQVFFRAYVEQSAVRYYTSTASFFTYPANDPGGFSIDQITTTSMRINWTSSTETGDAGGSIVVVSEVDATITAPADGTDYTPDATYPFSTPTGGGNDYVVYKGAGNSVTITGLPQTTTFYVAVYSASGLGNSGASGVRYKTPTTATGSAATTSGVTQPTNLWFHNIGSTAMTLYWTAGVGDGTIVLMKEGSAVDANPVNGVEHVADSVFGAGAQIGTGNYVVYRGNGGSVHVTGLTQGLTYYVAAYTYTGAGALVEYLLTGPATGSQTTADYTPHNVAVLNVDDTVTCQTACHGGHGSALVPRGAAQETACFSCHNPDSGFPGASSLTDIALHTNSKNSPVNSPGVVDCGACHELHNPAGDNTTYSVNPDTSLGGYNLHYLRANADKYVPSALASDLVNHADTNSDDWAFEGGVAYQGTCQICHTLTSNYQNTPGSNDSHQGSGTNNVDCRGCHTHGGSFAGAGGDCTACHSQVQDKDGAGGNPGRRIVTTEFSGGSIVSSHLPGTLDAVDCEVCHDQSNHQQGSVTLFNVDGGASIQIASYVDPRTNSTEAAKLTAFCVACHDSNGASGNTTPFTTGNTALDISTDWTNASHNTSGSVSCFGDGAFGCHGSGHGGQKLTLLAPSESPPTAPAYAEEQEGFCFNCHDSNGPSTIDIQSQFNTITDYQAQSTSGALVNQRHDITYADQTRLATVGKTQIQADGVVECNNCHGPHSATDAKPMKNPDTGNPVGTYNAANYGGGLNPLEPEACQDGAGSVPGLVCPDPDNNDYIEFCLACHDGAPPPGVTMASNMLNIANMYIPGGTATIDQHGSENGITNGKGGMKQPWTNSSNNAANADHSTPYAALQCTTCHGPHGSGNIFNLRTSITVAGVQMSVGGVGNMPVPARITDPTVYTLPPMDGRNVNEATGVQTDHYWGAWCSFCHKMDTHPGKVEADSCTGGHMHGGGAF